MFKKLVVIGIAITFGVTALTSAAQDEHPFANQIEARQSLMRIYAFNLGQLGAMAKGEVPYDATAASAASGNLQAAANMKNAAMWPSGSSSSAAGLSGVTAAKLGLWEDYESVGKKQQALREALAEMASVSGDGLDAVRGNMGAIGDACKGCHDDYRESDD